MLKETMIAHEGSACPKTVLEADCMRAGASRWPGRIARIFAAGVAMLGLAVLLGRALDVGALKSVLPGLAEMKANAALCFFLSGAILWAMAFPGCQRRYSIRTVGSFFIVAIGLGTAFDYPR